MGLPKPDRTNPKGFWPRDCGANKSNVGFHCGFGEHSGHTAGLAEERLTQGSIAGDRIKWEQQQGGGIWGSVLQWLGKN